MKKLIAVTLLSLALVAGAFAQLLPSLADDFEALMASVGQSAAPHLFQAAISSDIVGEAAFKGGFPHGSFTLLGLGADTGKGLAEALTDGSYAWKFALPMPSLLQTALGASTYQTISQVFPYPGLSLGLGFGLTRNLELLANGIFLPSGLAGLVPTLNSMDPSLSALGVSAKLRYVLFRDGPRRPAISIALGGAYSSFAFGVRNFDLAALAGGPVDVSGSALNLAGRLAVDAKAYGGGLEFHVSKRLPVVTLFGKMGLWLRSSTFSSDTNLTATLTPTIGSPTTQPIVAAPSATDTDLSAIASGGLEIRLGPVVLHGSLGLGLDAPLLRFSPLSLNGVTARTGIRFGF